MFEPRTLMTYNLNRIHLWLRDETKTARAAHGEDWSSVGKIHFQPNSGSDLTKVIFAEFKWVTGTTK